ncbi:uncharacterized protein LOC128211395 [Mya arenaria]|uniref:uncharacterized protein LOC128211395 n=1 Tax=Mya arenaria TaxID=6604 RepID=UPI0022E05E50|nr:uncharacterized protein LOC128211395 [Mya arenaria]
MTHRAIFLAVLATLTVVQIGKAQIPFMGPFGPDMMGIQANIANMAASFQYQNAEMARRSQWSRRFGPGEREFRTSDGGRGYVYNSPGGTFSSYSYSSGAPSSGYMYTYGPDGAYERHW